MTNRLMCVSTWVALLGIVGCGEPPIFDDDEAAAVKITAFDERFTEAFCESLRNCWNPEGGGELGVITNFIDTETSISCEAFLRRNAFLPPTSATQGVDDGTIDYDADEAGACLDAIARTCMPLEGIDSLPECRKHFEGRLELGDTCRASIECQPGAYCAGIAGCAGTCAPKIPTGDACPSTDACVDELGALGQCRGGHCIQVFVATEVGRGQPCGVLDDSGDEQTYALCGQGLFCLTPGAADSGTCERPLPPGASCDTDDQCAGGYCDGATCLELTMAHTAGAECNTTLGHFCDPSRHLTCVAGVCEVLGDGGPGASCNGDFIHAVATCNEGTFCDSVTDTCTLKRDNGDPCSDNLDCKSSFCSGAGWCSAPVLCE